jgi:hypothetical protein
MKAVWLYRIASIIFILFAAGHTYGFLSFRPASAEGRAVWEAMNNVRFQQGAASFTYGRFYVGFGLSASVFLLFLAFLTWYLDTLARNNPQAVGPLGWGLFVLQFVSIGMNSKFFALLPAIFAAVLAAVLGGAAWLVGAART